MIRSLRADLFYGAAYGLALSAALWTVTYDPIRLETGFWVLIALAAATGALRLRIRGLGTFDTLYPSTVAALILYGPSAALLSGIACCLVQGWTNPAGNRIRRSKTPTFDISRTTLATAFAGLAYLLLGGTQSSSGLGGRMLALGAHAITFAGIQHVIVRAMYRWCLRQKYQAGRRYLTRLVPGYLVGLLTGSLCAAWYAEPGLRPWMHVAAVSLLALSVWQARRLGGRTRRLFEQRAAGIYRSMALALARAMEAKDEGTRSHLRRVQELCVGIGRRMNLSPTEMEALSSAALLHDIGKIAVPEGILSKPGRLTPREMERIQLHPCVGAEILDSIPFPFPLARIVKHHHERWDGAGYPDGLQMEQIPLGSRILTAVDSYDALTTDRPYRRAVSREEAIDFLRNESELIFDPMVVETLIEHLDEQGESEMHFPVPVADEAESPDEESHGELKLEIAQRELQTLYEISRMGDFGLGIEEYLTIVSCKLESLIQYSSLVVYALDENERLLRASFAHGVADDRLKFMTIPLGERISGWAALQQKAMIGEAQKVPMDRDGSRSDLEDWKDDEEIGGLGATLVAPLVVGEQIVGVLTLYDRKGRRYGPDDRRILVRVAGFVAAAVGAAGNSKGPDTSLTDPLTGVPNARFLLLETAHRIATAADTRRGFGILAFRVNGIEQVVEQLGNVAADRFLCRVARRFAAACAESETLVRYGEDLFVVLAPTQQSGRLVDRWHQLAEQVEHPALETDDGLVHPVKLVAAHAAYPEDGEHLGSLIEVLDARLALASANGRAVLPFRRKEILDPTGTRN